MGQHKSLSQVFIGIQKKRISKSYSHNQTNLELEDDFYDFEQCNEHEAICFISTLKGVFAKNERGYRRNAKNKRF